MKSRQDESSEDGFTIIESLVAFFILSMVLMASIQLFSASIGMIGRSELFARDKLEIENLIASELPKILKTVQTDGVGKTRSIGPWKITVEPVNEPGSQNPTISVSAFLVRVKIESNTQGVDAPDRNFVSYRLLSTQAGS